MQNILDIQRIIQEPTKTPEGQVVFVYRFVVVIATINEQGAVIASETCTLSLAEVGLFSIQNHRDRKKFNTFQNKQALFNDIHSAYQAYMTTKSNIEIANLLIQFLKDENLF